MKKLIYSSSLLLAISILTLTCKKSGSTTSNTTGQSAFFKASIGSQSFVATTDISGTYTSGSLELDGQQGGNSGDIVLVKLSLAGFSPGQSGAVSTGASGTVLVNGVTQYTSKSCTVNITASSLSYISGSFAFTSTDSTKVVGTFSEPYVGGTPQNAFLINDANKRAGQVL